MIVSGFAAAQAPINSVEELLRLTAAERAEARAARLRGVVVSVLPGGQVFSLHRGAPGVMVYGALGAGGVTVGDKVEVEGVTTGNRNARLLANRIEIEPLPAELPPPTALGENLPFGTRPVGEWVELAGTIVRLEKYDVGWFVELARAGGVAHFVIPRRGRSVTDEFNGATVQVRGIVLPLELLARPEKRPGLWVDNWSRVEVLKPVKSPSPPAEPVTTTALLTGRLEGRRVELDGVVRRVTQDGVTVRVTVVRADRRFDALLPPGGSAPTNLVDARVTIRGTVTSRLNQEGQRIGIDLRLAEAADLKVTEAAPTKPHEVTATPIGEIGKPGAKAPHTRRLRVEGSVILNWSDRVFVEDATGTIEARLTRKTEVAVGSRVSVLGFKSLAAARPVLVDATLLRTGNASLSVPTAVPARRVAGEAAGRLVTVDGTVVAQTAGGGHQSLLLTDSALGFRAVLPADRGALPPIQPGSKLRLVGVCDPLSGHEGVTEAFELLLRKPADVTVLAAPSWWTPERSLAMVAMLVGGGLGALGWIGRLRGRCVGGGRNLPRCWMRVRWR